MASRLSQRSSSVVHQDTARANSIFELNAFPLPEEKPVIRKKEYKIYIPKPVDPQKLIEEKIAKISSEAQKEPLREPWRLFRKFQATKKKTRRKELITGETLYFQDRFNTL